MGLRLADDRRMRDIMRAATAWAGRLAAERLGTDHVLLAMTEQDDELAVILGDFGLTTQRVVEVVVDSLPDERKKLVVLEPDVLKAMGLDTDVVKARIEAAFGPGAAGSDRMWRSTPCEDRAFLSREMMAEWLGDTHVKPVHLLLAYLWDVISEVSAVLRKAGVDGRSLRAALVEQFAADAESGARLLERWDRSEQLASQRAAEVRAKYALDWVTADDVSEVAATLFAAGGTLAVKGVDALDLVWDVGVRSGYALIDCATQWDEHFWIAVEKELRQAIVFSATVNEQGLLAGIGFRDTSIAPAWARQERYMPLLPLAEL